MCTFFPYKSYLQAHSKTIEFQDFIGMCPLSTEASSKYENSFLRKEIQKVSRYNASILSEIEACKNKEIVVGYEHTLQCNYISDTKCIDSCKKEPWSIMTVTKIEKVKDRLTTWRYQGDPLRTNADFGNSINLKLTTYYDVLRLSRDLQSIGNNCIEFIRNGNKKTKLLRLLLNNMLLLQIAIDALYHLTIQFEYLYVENAKVKEGMDKIMEGFQELSQIDQEVSKEKKVQQYFLND